MVSPRDRRSRLVLQKLRTDRADRLVPGGGGRGVSRRRRGFSGRGGLRGWRRALLADRRLLLLLETLQLHLLRTLLGDDDVALLRGLRLFVDRFQCVRP